MTVSRDKRRTDGTRLQGFRALRPGRIHLRCVACGRKMSNVPRAPYDPASAVLYETWCDRHDTGKGAGGCYYDAAGVELSDDIVMEAAENA